MALFEKLGEKLQPMGQALGKPGAAIGGIGGALLAGPVGFAAGAGLGALGDVGAKARKEAAGRAVRPVRQSREMLQADVEALREDPMSLGMSEAERQQRISEATAQANAAAAAQTRELARAQLGAQEFQQGAFQEAAEQIAAGTDIAAAQAAAQAQALNQQIIAQEGNRIRQALEMERQRVKENTRYWTRFGIDTAAGVVSAAMGLPGVAGMFSGSPPAAPPTQAAMIPSAQPAINMSPYGAEAGSQLGDFGGYGGGGMGVV